MRNLFVMRSLVRKMGGEGALNYNELKAVLPGELHVRD